MTTPASSRQITPAREPVSTTAAAPRADSARLHQRRQPARAAAMVIPAASRSGTWTTAEPPIPVASRAEPWTPAERGHWR
jgi:hypothetical protein